MTKPTSPTRAVLGTVCLVATAVVAACAGAPPSARRSATTGPTPPSISAPTSTPAVPPPSAAVGTVSATAAPPATTVSPSRAPGAVATPPPTPPATTAVARTPVAPAATCPTSLAARLTSTGSATQLITVDAPSYGTTAATLALWRRVGSCWVAAGGPWPARLGATGFSDHHREGDFSTPTGAYGIGAVMYGNAVDPGVRYAYHRLVCGDWWNEDPTTTGYNTFEHVPCGQTPPFSAGSEALWQEVAPYPSFAVIDYNAAPVVAGAGSAIFLHASTGGSTAGCVSIPLADLDTTLRWLDPTAAPLIVMGPDAELARF